MNGMIYTEDSDGRYEMVCKKVWNHFCDSIGDDYKYRNFLWKECENIISRGAMGNVTEWKGQYLWKSVFGSLYWSVACYVDA